MRAGLLDPGESYELVGLPRPAGALPITGRRADAPLDLARTALPPVLRPGAGLVVLDVTEFYGETSGGVRTYLDRKAAYVAAHPALRQVVVVPGARDAVGDGDGVRCYQLRGARVPMRPPYRFMLALRQPRRIVEHERPHVVEIGSPGLVPWIVRFATERMRGGPERGAHGARGVPLVHFWHSHYPRQLGGSHRAGAGRVAEDGVVGRLAWRYARAIDRLFDVTVVASTFVARELAAAGIDRVARVPLGVDLAHFHPRRRAHAPVTRAAYGLPLGLPIGLYVGRFAADKRIDVVLDAWRVVRQRTGAALVLVGGGPEEARLRAHPEAARATWLPFERDRERLADLMAAVDVQVAPGPLETFGLAVLEGMASGTPVVAVDAGAAAELVARSGGGRCFAPGDAASLADAVVAVLDGGAAGLHALGRAARAHAEREHAWETVFDALFGLHAAVAHGAWARPGRAP
jgi:alpha-1,6-mannosyltransferase